MTGSRWTTVVALATAITGGTALRSGAQDKPKEAAPAEAKPAEDRPKPPGAEGKPKEAPPKITASADGFVIQSESGDYRIRIGGYAQGDGRFYLGDDAKLATDTFLLRRVRPSLQGTVAQRFDFYFLPDFGGGTTVIQDAYLDARFSPLFRLRAGKFKGPVGLERLQSGANILFVERAAPTSIVPNRDVGLQLHGEAGAGVFAYQIALQNGVVDGGSGDSDTNDGKDLALRAFLKPFKKGKGPLQGLGFGAAGQLGKQLGTAVPSYRSPGQVVFFSYVSGVSVDGTRKRFSPQAHYYAGPLGLLAEYASSSTPLVKGKVTSRIKAEAWQAAASVFLTGEKPGWTAVKPNKPFDPGKGQWGAFELAARVHALQVEDDAFDLGFADVTKSARKATSWALGLNWHLNRTVKYVLNYEQTSFEGGAASQADRPSEKAFLVRAQVSF